MSRGYFKGKVMQPKPVGLISPVVPGPCKTIHKSRRLTLTDKYSVLHAILVKHEFQADVARRHQVRPKTVSVLVNQAKKRPELLRELHAKSEEQARSREAISRSVLELNERDASISSAAQLVRTVRERSGLEVRAALVKDTMRRDHGMRYRRI